MRVETKAGSRASSLSGGLLIVAQGRSRMTIDEREAGQVQVLDTAAAGMRQRDVLFRRTS